MAGLLGRHWQPNRAPGGGFVGVFPTSRSADSGICVGACCAGTAGVVRAPWRLMWMARGVGLDAYEPALTKRAVDRATVARPCPPEGRRAPRCRGAHVVPWGVGEACHAPGEPWPCTREVRSVAREARHSVRQAPGVMRKAPSLARKALNLACKARGAERTPWSTTRKASKPARKAKRPSRKANSLARKAPDLRAQRFLRRARLFLPCTQGWATPTARLFALRAKPSYSACRPLRLARSARTLACRVKTFAREGEEPCAWEFLPCASRAKPRAW